VYIAAKKNLYAGPKHLDKLQSEPALKPNSNRKARFVL